MEFRIVLVRQVNSKEDRHAARAVVFFRIHSLPFRKVPIIDGATERSLLYFAVEGNFQVRTPFRPK